MAAKGADVHNDALEVTYEGSSPSMPHDTSDWDGGCRHMPLNRLVVMHPRDGDVLVSNPTATLEHEISIVPARPHIFCATHAVAVAKARELAKEHHVDAWLTEDHTHYLLLESYRERTE
jgi:hypothetical protein